MDQITLPKMDLTTFNDVTLIALSALVTGLIHLCQRFKLPTLPLLAVVAIFAAGVYEAFLMRHSAKEVEQWGMTALQIAGTANLIYHTILSVYQKVITKNPTL